MKTIAKIKILSVTMVVLVLLQSCKEKNTDTKTNVTTNNVNK